MSIVLNRIVFLCGKCQLCGAAALTSLSLQGWSEQSSQSILDSKDNAAIESLVVLLKCLKIMENATFLSMDNQVTSIYLPVVDCLSVSLNSWILSSRPVFFRITCFK